MGYMFVAWVVSSFWPCSSTQEWEYHIAFSITISVGKGKFGRSVARRRAAAAAGWARGRRQWHLVSSRWPSGALVGTFQAIHFDVFSYWFFR